MSILSRLFLYKQNPKLEIKFGRRFPKGFINETIKRVWSAVYERSGLEKILRSTPRGQTPSSVLSKTKTTDKRSVQRDVRRNAPLSDEEKEIERKEKILRLNALFNNKAFNEFLEMIKEREALDLEELVKPVLKNDKITYDQYSFLLRGRLEAYEAIREIIKEVKSLAEKYALSD